LITRSGQRNNDFRRQAERFEARAGLNGDRSANGAIEEMGAGIAGETDAAGAAGTSVPSATAAMESSGLLVLLEVMSILETGNKACGANRHTQVVGFSEQRSSEQIEKRGQLAMMKGELFVRSCIGCDMPTRRAASLGHDRP
jgi:hypothetical protein